MAEVKKLKRIRSSLRGIFTRIENYINEDLQFSIEEIATRLQTLKDNFSKFQELQNEIEKETEDSELNKEIDYRYEVEELYTKLRSKFIQLQKESEITIVPPSSATDTQSIYETARTNKETPFRMNFQPFQENETFTNFTKRLKVYFMLNNITDGKVKVYVLLCTISPNLHERMYNICSPEDPLNMTFEEIARMLDDYIDPKPSIWTMRHRFISRMQQQEETVVTYASELKKLSANCEFKCNNCKKQTSDSFLCLQLIRGLNDGEIRTKILQEKDTTSFSQLVQIATATEMGKNENATMSSDIHKPNTINKITTPSAKTSNYNHNPPVHTKVNTRLPITIKDLKGKCFRCGKDDHRANECGAITSTCRKCQKIGHLARVCLQRYSNSHQVNESSSNISQDSIADINLVKSEISKKYTITLKIEDKTVCMEFDTGATLSSMSLKDFKNMNIQKKLFKTEIKMRTYTGEIIRPVGVAFVKCLYNTQLFYGKLYIIDKNVDPIFGRSWMKELHDIDIADIRTVQTTIYSNNLEQLLEEFSSSVFTSDLGKIPNHKAHLSLKENTQPIFIKPRRIPYALKPKVDEEIERLCTQGVLTKVEHAEWGTPIVPIVKPNGSIRLCADYKITLNKVIKDEQYPIPIIEDIFSEMNGGKLFCTLDITQAYLNLEMDEESAHMQTLSTHKGTYKVNRLMFGVKVAPSLWQKFMDKLLQDLAGVKCFFDDIIIQGSCEDELLQRLRQVLQKLKESNLRVNKEKCHFFKQCINYLGHTIDKNGLHKNKDKIKAITSTLRPTNINELRTFLGMANYYNKFINNLASITSPLNELLKKRAIFTWSPKCEESFKKIKEEILSERVLIHFDPKKPLILATDASPLGLGAVLSHRLPDGCERPIAFASRSLSSSEKKYSQIDKEATAIYWGLKKFFHYCYGRKFTLVTDHKPLTSIFHPHQTLPAMSTMRLFHYAHFLSGFSYEIDYRSSANNSNADYLSRFPVETVNDNKKDQHSQFQLQQIYKIEVNPDIIARETKDDNELLPLLQALKTGRTLRELGYNDNEFTLQDDCILKGTRVIIPSTLRSQIINELHTGHTGILKMKLLARSYVYWKNMDRDIENKVKSCRACRLEQNQPAKAALHHWEETTGPWQRIHIDFAGPVSGYQLFIIIDAFTKWVEIIPAKITTSYWCIRKLKEIFSTFGAPYILVSDNGRQFISQEFKKFLSDYNITHKTIAPYHPATNGQAERTVQTIKRALRSMEGESGDLVDKLTTIKTRLRRTPGPSTQSPYQLMFGREVRTKLHAMLLKTENTTHHRTLPDNVRQFKLGDRVQARSYSSPHQRWTFGRIRSRLGHLHYEVLTDDGNVWRRHLDQLLAAPQVQQLESRPRAVISLV